MTRQEFLTAATAAARAASAASGLPAGITVAQAALESAFGDSQLARNAHNYFGIKARPGADAISLPTWEVVNGRRIRTVARFARFASMEDCFRARDQLILRAPCYAEARACAHDPAAFTRALAAHWATDPNYAEKVLGVYRKNGLEELDAVKSPNP